MKLPISPTANQHFNSSIGQPRLHRYTYDIPNRYYLAIKLVTQHMAEIINHMFDHVGQLMSVDTLLSSSTEKCGVCNFKLSRQFGSGYI